MTPGLRVIIADPVNDAHDVHPNMELPYLAARGGGNQEAAG